MKQESNVCHVCIVYHNNNYTCTLLNSDKNSARVKVAGNGKSPGGGGGGGRVSWTNYLDKSILVDIANIQIIAFASIFSLFALSILIKKPILFF